MMPTPTAPDEPSALAVEFELLRDDLLAQFERVNDRLHLLESRMDGLVEEKAASPGEIIACAIGIGDGSPVECNEPTPETQPNSEKDQVAAGALGSVGVGSDPTSITSSRVSVHDDPDDQVGMVPFAESAWTYPVVICLVRAGVVEAIFAVLLLGCC